MASDLRIAGVKALAAAGPPELLDDVDIWISGDRIAAITPANAQPPISGLFETLTFSNALVMPGMINAHSHSSSALGRGTVAGAPLDLFVMEAMAKRAPQTMRHVKVNALLQSLEMLKHGITGVVDHFRFGAVPSVEAVGAVFEAYREIGIRAAVAPMFEDRRYIDSLPIDQGELPEPVRARWRGKDPPSADRYFEMMEDVVRRWPGRDRLELLLGVDGPQRCTPRLLEMAGDFARRHGIGLHTHLLEAKTQALMVPPGFGGSFVAYLDSFGLIGPNSSLAHFVWCTDRDVELAADRGVNVVNNPVSNLLLGSGLQPTARLLRAGVSVAIGSDGTSGSRASLFDQMKLSVLLSRISEPDCDRWMTALQAWEMATANGGRVLGQPGMLGVLKIGAHADLVIINLDTPTYQPLGDLWNHLVMYETGSSVDTVIVGGRVVVRGGRCTTVNEEDLYAEAKDLASQTRASDENALAATRTERPVFQAHILKALQTEIGVDRFAHLR